MITTPPLTSVGPTDTARSQPTSVSGDAFCKALRNAQHASPAAYAAGLTNVSPMLLHEIGLSETQRRDQEARGRGKALLEALRHLQRLTLSADNSEPTLDHIAGLLSSIPQADDPELASIVRAIAVRAAVEVCRRRPA